MWDDIRDPNNFRAPEPVMGQHSTFFMEHILTSILWGQEKDANGVRRRLPSFIADLMYSFGPKNKEQRYVALVPDMSELVLWSQETGHTPMGYLATEHDYLDAAVKRVKGNFSNLDAQELINLKLYRLASYCTRQCNAFLNNLMQFHAIRVAAAKDRLASQENGEGAGAGACGRQPTRSAEFWRSSKLARRGCGCCTRCRTRCPCRIGTTRPIRRRPQ